MSRSPVTRQSNAEAEFRAFRETPKFASVDGLRALAIAMVVWHHGAGHLNHEEPLLLRLRGVDLFFALSGFLITTLLLRERDRDGSIALGRFYRNRVLRTCPLYYLVLAVYALLVGLMRADEPAGREFFANVPYFATYTANWFVGAAPGVIFSFAWSLSAQEQFYAVWPVALRYLRSSLAVAAVMLLTTLSAIAALGWFELFPRGSFGDLVVRNFSFAVLAGALLAYALNTRASYTWIWRVLGRRWSPLALLVLLLASLADGVPIIIRSIVMVSVVACIVVREDNLFAPVLRLPALGRVGVVSYGIYMLHGLAYNGAQIVERVFGLRFLEATLFEFVGVFFAAFALAELSRVGLRGAFPAAQEPTQGDAAGPSQSGGPASFHGGLTASTTGNPESRTSLASRIRRSFGLAELDPAGGRANRQAPVH